MTTRSHILFALVTALYFICTIVVAKDEEHPAATIVHIIDGLPKGSRSTDVLCKFNNGESLGMHTLNVGDDYKWSPTGDFVYFCRAMWGNRFASWHGYEPTRDASHATVFWLVKESGFFRSWDKKQWVKEAEWESE